MPAAASDQLERRANPRLKSAHELTVVTNRNPDCPNWDQQVLNLDGANQYAALDGVYVNNVQSVLCTKLWGGPN